MKHFLGVRFALLTLFIVSIFVPHIALAADEAVQIYFFYSDSCQHCAAEKVFLNKIEQTYGDDININRYEVTTSLQNQMLFQEFASKSAQPINGVPATFIGSSVTVGFGSEETTGAIIETNIASCLDESCPDALALIRGESETETTSSAEDTQAPHTIDVPVFGSIDTNAYSLVGLTAIIAAIDGFNPCAMWVLLILISLLLGMKNRRRMWILGMSFIAASAAVYFIFLAAWLEMFRFVGVVRWLQVLIGVGALVVGVYYLRRFTKMKPGECEVTDVEQRRKITDRIKRVVREKALWIALPGIIGVAFIVNLIELMCSAGLPAIYTQVLSLSDLSRLEFYGYLLLYVIIFMLDDMFVFAVAMFTMKAVGTEGKFSRWATLVGGIVILILGFLLIARPELLSFGM